MSMTTPRTDADLFLIQEARRELTEQENARQRAQQGRPVTAAIRNPSADSGVIGWARKPFIFQRLLPNQ